MLEDIVAGISHPKTIITIKIEPVTYISMFVYVMNFELPEMTKSEVLDFSGVTCLSEGYFIHILYVKVDLE